MNPKYRKVLTDAQQHGKIPWDLIGASNGAPGVAKYNYRRFALRDVSNPVKAGGSGRTYQQVLVGNTTKASARLVPISQDVDMMALLSANGDILASRLREKMYLYLSDILDLQHGETPSFINNGEMIFQDKAKYLADTIPGGEALAVFGPDGSVRAGFYNPALCIFINATKAGKIFFQGGYNDPFAQAVTRLSLSFAQLGKV